MAAEAQTSADTQLAALRADGMCLAAPSHVACYVQGRGVEGVAGGCGLMQAAGSASLASWPYGVAEALGGGAWGASGTHSQDQG